VSVPMTMPLAAMALGAAGHDFADETMTLGLRPRMAPRTATSPPAATAPARARMGSLSRGLRQQSQ